MTKKKSKSFAKKQATKWNSDATQDSMSAAKRRYGGGRSK